MPDIVGIFADAPVGGEDPCPGDVVKRHSVPAHRIGIRFVRLFVYGEIIAEIGKTHIRIGNGRSGKKIVCDVFETFAVEPLFQRRRDLSDLNVFVIIYRRVVPVFPEILHLFGIHAENENIVLSDLLFHFHVRPVERADRKRAVDHELHVPRAARLFARRGDLLGNFGCRHKRFRHGDAVIFQIDHVQFFADAPVRIFPDIFRKEAKQLDDLFRHVIPGRRLRSENKCFRLNGKIGVFFQFVIEMDDIHRVQKLPFVFVQSFCLNVEQTVGVDLYALFSESVFRKLFFFNLFYLGKPFQHRFVVFERLKLRKFGSVFHETFPDTVDQKRRKLFVGLAKPSSVSDAVRNVGKLFGINVVEILENTVFDNLAVKRGNAVYFVRGDHGKVCHSHLPVREDRHSFDLIPVARITLPHLPAETLIDLLDNGVNSRQASFDKIFLPFFERFAHNGMVRVCHRSRHDIPGIVPRKTVFVHQKSHHLGDAERRMRIVDMDRREIGKGVNIVVSADMPVDDVLQGRRNEKILLF